MKKNPEIRIKSPEELKILREAGIILAQIFLHLKSSLNVGVSTIEIDRVVENLILKSGVQPAFKGYHGFPNCSCISVNEEVVHGIPCSRVLKSGDVASVDVGILYNGFYSDMAVTFGIGVLEPSVQKLLDVTRQALLKGIAEARPGNRLGDISSAIQKYVESRSFSVVRDFVGHGIGKQLHEDPEIPNYGQPKTGPFLKSGMVFAIEPMVNAGSCLTKTLKDGWTVVTSDRKWSAHFEHTIAITDSGPVILTE